MGALRSVLLITRLRHNAAELQVSTLAHLSGGKLQMKLFEPFALVLRHGCMAQFSCTSL